MTKLIVDVSSVVKRCLYVGKDAENGKQVEFNGKLVQVNSAQFGYDNSVNSIVSVLETLNLTPADTLLVYEQGHTKARRQQMYAGYKMKPAGASELMESFGQARDMVLSAFRGVGATALVQNNVEADDAIAYLCKTVPGKRIIFSEDGDLAQLIDADTMMWRQGGLLDRNPYGPFEIRHIRLMKALVGDSSDGYGGAKGFGEKAWLDLLVNFDTSDLDALESMIQKGVLHELAADVEGFKPFQKIVDGAAHVYESYACAGLRPEWVNTADQPLTVLPPEPKPTEDYRLRKFGAAERAAAYDEVRSAITGDLAARIDASKKKHCVFDCEILGTTNPIFVVCTLIVETGERRAFWHHVSGDMEALLGELRRTDLTWVSFNGLNFDGPIISAATQGHPTSTLKRMAHLIINEEMKPWDVETVINFTNLHFDHVDISEVAPGVRISLKTYMGRMGYPTLQDMPFDHDMDLQPEHYPIVESYCFNDCGGTADLFRAIQTEIKLREEMGREYGLDLRSRSDAQVAEAVLRKVLGIKGKVERGHAPHFVRYTPPPFIRTSSAQLQQIIRNLTACEFKINMANGQVISPEILAEPVQFGYGTYQMGVGGLHSTHDVKLHLPPVSGRRRSDFDVASYYPNIMLLADLIPIIGGDASMGERFITEYRKIYERRIDAKRSKLKQIANTLKIVLNGTFGKLGSIYSAFYAPELMLAVTLTGQLNLMCLIHDLEQLPDVKVCSANTDGIMVDYPEAQREAVLAVIRANATLTGFEYEETPYRSIAMKDVNNYVAITDELDAAIISPDGGIKFDTAKGGVAKRKGLYASTNPKENPLYLMKNPTMEVCSNMAIDYLRDGVHPQESIRKYTDIKDYVAIRNVKRPGGVQHTTETEVDDWVLWQDNGDKTNVWIRQKHLDAGRSPWDQGGGGSVMRKSRPKPVVEYSGGEPFGRIARWYMTREKMPPITYVESGNKVPKTDGARVCLNLPAELPADLDRGWYIREALSVLEDLGVTIDEEEMV